MSGKPGASHGLAGEPSSKQVSKTVIGSLITLDAAAAAGELTILPEVCLDHVPQSTTDNCQKKLVVPNKMNESSNEISLRRELEEVKNNLNQAELKLSERNRIIANQENQINALSKQVSSLKEVIAITKNLLEIRNMEVKHLQEDVDNMESKISGERARHDAMLNKMNAAVRLNADLKAEYETQLGLFQDLRGKYQEKVTLLSAENKSLEIAAPASTAE